MFVIDLKNEIHETDGDLAGVQSLLDSLVGQAVLKAEFSYGDELQLHFGKPISYRHPKLKDEQEGSWVLGTRASSWLMFVASEGRVISSDPVAGHSLSEAGAVQVSTVATDRAESLMKGLAGAPVIAAVPFSEEGSSPYAFPLYRHPGSVRMLGIGLAIRLADGSALTVFPSDERDDADQPIADWELFTPFNKYLRVGPGLLWSYSRSDVPEEFQPSGHAPVNVGKA